jgi:glycosyltransferase involved in cell wall biosynthesis
MQDGVQGIVIRPRDIEGLADAILKLGCDPQLNEAMGKAAARVGQTRNTWQDYSNRLYEEIKRRHQCLLS